MIELNVGDRVRVTNAYRACLSTEYNDTKGTVVQAADAELNMNWQAKVVCVAFDNGRRRATYVGDVERIDDKPAEYEEWFA